jgi:hypothetical protein
MIRSCIFLAALLLSPTCFGQESFTVRYDGFGPVLVGMSKTEVVRLLGVKLVPGGIGSDECEYLRPAKGLGGVLFMFIRGKVARIDVNQRGVATEDGVRVGDPLSKIETAYPRGFFVEPHHYIEWPKGKYVTVRTADGKYGIRFEIETGRVIRYYAGRYAEIQLVEGCQ